MSIWTTEEMGRSEQRRGTRSGLGPHLEGGSGVGGVCVVGAGCRCRIILATVYGRN